MSDLTPEELAVLRSLLAKAGGAAEPEDAAPEDAGPRMPVLGDWVHYTLSETDAEAINARRAGYSSNAGGLDDATAEKLKGYQEYRGNFSQAGQTFPAIVVRNWSGTTANLQVLLDGTDIYWATSASPGTEPGHPGTYAFPEDAPEDSTDAPQHVNYLQ